MAASPVVLDRHTSHTCVTPTPAYPSGEVPGLFSSEELAKELMPLEQRRNEDSNYTGPPTLYAYFIHRWDGVRALPCDLRPSP